MSSADEVRHLHDPRQRGRWAGGAAKRPVVRRPVQVQAGTSRIGADSPVMAARPVDHHSGIPRPHSSASFGLERRGSKRCVRSDDATGRKEHGGAQDDAEERSDCGHPRQPPLIRVDATDCSTHAIPLQLAAPPFPGPHGKRSAAPRTRMWGGRPGLCIDKIEITEARTGSACSRTVTRASVRVRWPCRSAAAKLSSERTDRLGEASRCRSVSRSIARCTRPLGRRWRGDSAGSAPRSASSQLAGPMLQRHHLGVQRAAGALAEVQPAQGALPLAQLAFENAEQGELVVAVHARSPPAAAAGPTSDGATSPGAMREPPGPSSPRPGRATGPTRTSRGRRRCPQQSTARAPPAQCPPGAVPAPPMSSPCTWDAACRQSSKRTSHQRFRSAGEPGSGQVWPIGSFAPAARDTAPTTRRTATRPGSPRPA